MLNFRLSCFNFIANLLFYLGTEIPGEIVFKREYLLKYYAKFVHRIADR